MAKLIAINLLTLKCSKPNDRIITTDFLEKIEYEYILFQKWKLFMLLV